MLSDPVCNADEFGLRTLSIHHHMAITVGKRDEIAFRINDDLLHPLSRLLEQPSQQVGFAGPRIPLNKKARGQELLDIELGRSASGHGPHIDTDLHCTNPVFSDL